MAMPLLSRPVRATPRFAITVLGLLALAVVAIAGVSLFIGSAAIDIAALFGEDSDSARLARDVLLGLRIPRTLAAFAVGGLLAMAGALMQVLLRNPLADPYVLGVSGGAGVGALTLLLLGAGGWALHFGAGAGALLAILLVFAFGRGDGSWTQARLLLTGVAIAAFCGAIQSLLLSLAPDGVLRGMVFWLLGDLAGAVWQPALLALALITAMTASIARDLNILALGAAPASALGVSLAGVRATVYVAAAAATAVAVTTAGTVGFVGLIVPHALRLLIGNDQRVLLPASALAGGAFLMMADLVARTLVAPQQLPIGVVTAAIGAPCFLLLLNRGASR